VKNAASGFHARGHHRATILQHRVGRNLFVADGISKTAVWRKQDELTKGTSQILERSRYDMPVSTMG